MGRGLNLNLALAMAAKSIKPVSINDAVLNDLARYDNFIHNLRLLKIGIVSHTTISKLYVPAPYTSV